MTTPISVRSFSTSFVEQLNANFAAIDGAIERAVMQGVEGDAAVSRDLRAGRNVDAAGYRINGAPVTGRSGAFTTLYDSAGIEVVKCGNATDPANQFSNDSHTFYNRGANTVFARLTGTGLCVGGTPSQARFEAVAPDGTLLLGLRGATRGMRVRSSSAACTIEGVDSTLVGSLQPLYLNGSHVALQAQGAMVALADSAAFRPATDNAIASGTSTSRWSVMFAATGTINTSGRDAKVGIRPPSDAERRAARRILEIGPKLYRFQDAVEAKGDDARVHAGYVAEDVRDALAAEGLDPWRYGFLCQDPVFRAESFAETVKRPRTRSVQAIETTVEIRDGRATRVRRTVRRDEPVGDFLPVFDEDGQPVLREIRGEDGRPVHVPVLHFEPEYESVEQVGTRQVATGETRLGLRYSELEAFLRCAG